MLWFWFGVMLLTAALVVALPMYRVTRRWSPDLASAIFTMIAVPVIVYTAIGMPSTPESMDGTERTIEALNERLQTSPEDIEGWRLLGRFQAQKEDYAAAALAFERVVALEEAPSGQSLAELGEALLMVAGPEGSERANSLFESALTLEPTNQTALFYGGIAASERGESLLAANRWETLLAITPSPELQQILLEGISTWRKQGELAAQAPEMRGRVLEITVSLSADAEGAVAPDDTVFIIARDPSHPAPPIAVARRTVAELDERITISDADAMLQGRSLSGYDELEIVGRISLSNEPMAKVGDWYGERQIFFPNSDLVNLVIDKQVQ